MLLRPTSVAMLLAAGLLYPSAALADEHCESEEIVNPGDNSVTTIFRCPGDADDGGGGDGEGRVDDDGGDGVTCVRTIWPTPPAEEALTVWLEIDDRGEDGVWGHGHFNCSDGSERNWWVCYEFCDGGGPGADVAARVDGVLAEATARVDPPLPGLRHSFDQPAHDGEVRAIVKAETWWWAEDTLDPVVVREDAPPVWAEVTATPAEMTIDPGDRTGEFVCPGPGLAWDFGRSYYDQVPGEPRGACVHVYEALFDSVTATMTVAWTITYEGFAPGLGNVSGTLAPIVREQQVSFPVKEIQSHIVTGEGG